MKPTSLDLAKKTWLESRILNPAKNGKDVQFIPLVTPSGHVDITLFGPRIAVVGDNVYEPGFLKLFLVKGHFIVLESLRVLRHGATGPVDDKPFCLLLVVGVRKARSGIDREILKKLGVGDFDRRCEVGRSVNCLLASESKSKFARE